MSRRQLERGVPQRGMVGADGVVPLPATVDASQSHVLHVDMDAFFAAVEELDHPEARGRPLIVGHPGPRGVVSSANYQARAYGVHSAMPMVRALRACPDAVVIPPDHRKYAQASEAVMDILGAVTPQVEALSLDEAFLDVGGARLRMGDPVHIAEFIRGRISSEQRLTCSVGVGPTKFVAKLASTVCKPDGLLYVPADRVLDFLHPLPVGAMWGVGEKTESALHRLGLRTIGDVATRVSDEVLRDQLGVASGNHLAALARGEDPRKVVPGSDTAERSISAEETFAQDTADAATINRELLRLSEKVARRTRAEGLVARTVTVKLRRADFTTITRSHTLDEGTALAREIYTEVRHMYAAAGMERVRLRLVGVRVSGLVDAESQPRQMTLEEDPGDAWNAAERAMDQVVKRFGADSIRPAALKPPDDSSRHDR
ncbi:DNA polymerase IV [Spiractinospora alimapuensis]|uniref:DNA polymerase IV n=1 Tax=Spiractinospora alimapuensis TaxID=2820884 RepID=UPI001EEC12F8|nr:DNA polymerase IV [Spiractinospora alimapuensis]QVQ53145.1 DNA polymerase IV [Spiractinospora alimapuensis]